MIAHFREMLFKVIPEIIYSTLDTNWFRPFNAMFAMSYLSTFCPHEGHSTLLVLSCTLRTCLVILDESVVTYRLELFKFKFAKPLHIHTGCTSLQAPYTLSSDEQESCYLLAV